MDEVWLTARWLADMLDMVQEFGRLAVFQRNLRTGEAHWSRQMFRMFGFDPSQSAPSAAQAIERVHPEDREAALKAWTDAARAPGRYEHRFRLVRPDGTVCNIHGLCDVRGGADGQPELMIGVNIDDTDTMRRMQTQAHRIDLITQAAGVGVWSIDVEADVVEWNDQMFHIYGVPASSRAPSMHRMMEDLIHPDDRALVAQQRERAAASGSEGLQFEFRIVRPDGSLRWVSSWSRREKSPEGRVMAYGVTVDVTERQQALAQLRAMDELALLASESAGIGAWERDLRTRTTTWNAQMYRLRGLSPDSGMTVEELRRLTHHPEDAPELEAKFLAAELEGLDYEHEFRVVWPDGSLHWLATRGVVRRDAQGKVTGLTGVNWDITERKRAEQALRDKASAEQASRAKSEFLSRMSHEFRTPLNAVLGFAQMMLRDTHATLDEAQAERARHVEAAGLHLMALIDDVLDLSSVESDQLNLDMQAVSLPSTIDEVLRWTQPEADKAGVTLHVDPARAWVRADPRRLRQVLANLLSNAVKYNRRGGGVWIACQPYPVRGADGWQLRVRDSGRGMSEVQCAHLFEPFNRLGAERDGVAGTGIGLAIVRHLVELMGGSIEVRSELGQGSEFRIGLPATTPPDSALPAAAAAPPTVGETALSLLYIEDNAVNALLVEQLLALRPQVRLLSAADGASGVELARSGRPDVVLIDMQLPDFDGYEVLRRLRVDPGPDGRAFIALSASAMPEDVRRAMEAGFTDYWTKPIDFARFLSGLDALAAGLKR